jgi:catechol 2,3-dioxygenase-like lactoylglutathione lyase family enzyme
MIGYITIGAADIERAKTFYDSVLGTIGWKQFADYGDPVGYAAMRAAPARGRITARTGMRPTCAIPPATRGRVQDVGVRQLHRTG